ncbi:aromatic amino acid ammonia-lyase [Svornostia abyssi]|uniref:Aromatic amino acid ammonia-lyase n=1 Tax=Svornostia abyssi TaxID=2898438 RepID=A0ABY5PIX6_9ACTN|nr:aromatic amino acid ammonia-lyase [Parviterribacteraceae bacterium J379]
MPEPVVLGGGAPLDWATYEAVVHGHAPVEFGDRSAALASRAALEARIAAGDVIYSVTTGYGAEAGRALPPDKLAEVQRNTVRSHAVGVGDDAPEPVVRGMMLLTAQAIAQGPPGYRPEIGEAYVRALNAGVVPRVPMQGSQSASDLIPNAHLALGVLDVDTLEAKEGGVINSAAFSVALAFEAVREAQALVEGAERVAAMTLQALGGHAEAFDERLVGLRPHPGALASAAHMRSLLEGSKLVGTSDRPHDPFSLRCLPQIHGAVRDQISFAREVVARELCAVTDNPVVLSGGEVLSGGLFHGEPLALPMDGVSLALTEVATISVRRSQHLVGGALGLPARLVTDPSRLGLLMLPASAAGLLSEARLRATAASRESVPVDVMEDHVAMSGVAARQVLEVGELVRKVVAVELVCGGVAVDLVGVALASPAVRGLHARLRKVVAAHRYDGRTDPTVAAVVV